MADHLVRRGSLWRFVRRVPKEYAHLDRRVIVQHSTKVKVADDPRGARARRVADQLNEALERYWRELAESDHVQALADYEAARNAARRLRIPEPIADPAQRTIAELLERIAKLEGKLAEDRHAVLAVYDAAPKPSLTFKQCAEQYIDGHRAGWKSAKHLTEWQSTLANYVYPILGNLTVDKIGGNGDGTDLVMRVLQPIWHSKTETASRVRGRMELVLDWAKARGYREGENPARWKGHLDKLLPAPGKVAPKEHHPAMPYKDVPAFMQKLRARKGVAARALEFTILTAGRTSEILEAPRSEIDVGARMWVIPAKRMKAGKEHRVPLSDRAIEIIKARPPGKLLFASPRTGGPLANNQLIDVLRRMGIREIVPHGFRSTFMDWGHEVGDYPKELLDLALAHTVGDKVEAAYRRGSMLTKRIALMDDWGSYCNGGHR
jgi:integrase